MTIRANNIDHFALDVWATLPKLKSYARRLWNGNDADAEDGMSETVCRALSKQHQFRGGNLAAWLTHVMRNIRRDQLAKGYRKGAGKPKVRVPRLVFSDAHERTLTDLCDPESILIAAERFNRASDTVATKQAPSASDHIRAA